MRKMTFGMRCSVARSLEVMGEWWSPLILREAFFGTRRFRDFQSNLGIAANILASRLAKLVDAGVFAQIEPDGGGKHMEYQLTDKGQALFPVIVALMQWGDQWESDAKGPPIKILDKKKHREIATMQIFSDGGEVLTLSDVEIIPGSSVKPAKQARRAIAKENN